MKTTLARVIPTVAGFMLAATAVQAQFTLFSDDFSESDGTSLGAKAADVGGPWTLNNGGVVVSSGAASTVTAATAADSASAPFESHTWSSGETLSLDFTTLAVGNNWANNASFAGLSLTDAGSSQIYIGHTASHANEWSVIVNGVATEFSVSGRAQPVSLSYTYGTGAWSATIGSETQTGTTTAELAFQNVFTLAGANNTADIAVDSVSLTAVPEPSAYAVVMGAVALVAGAWSRRSRRLV